MADAGMFQPMVDEARKILFAIPAVLVIFAAKAYFVDPPRKVVRWGDLALHQWRRRQAQIALVWFGASLVSLLVLLVWL